MVLPQLRKPGALVVATKSRYANGHARRQIRAWLRAQGLPCHICGRPIDYDLPAGDPMSFEVDEMVPVSRGGSPIDRASHLQPTPRQPHGRRRRGGRTGREEKPRLVGGDHPLSPAQRHARWQCADIARALYFHR